MKSFSEKVGKPFLEKYESVSLKTTIKAFFWKQKTKKHYARPFLAMYEAIDSHERLLETYESPFLERYDICCWENIPFLEKHEGLFWKSMKPSVKIIHSVNFYWDSNVLNRSASTFCLDMLISKSQGLHLLNIRTA